MADGTKLAVCGSLCTLGGFGAPLLALTGTGFGIFGKSKVVKQAEEYAANCQNYQAIVNQYTQECSNYIIEVDDLIEDMHQLQEDYEEEVKKVSQEIYTIVENTEEEGATEQDEITINELKNSLSIFGEQSNTKIGAISSKVNSRISNAAAFSGIASGALSYAQGVEDFGNRCNTKKRKIYKRAAKIVLPASTELKNSVQISQTTLQNLAGRKVDTPQIAATVNTLPSLDTTSENSNSDEVTEESNNSSEDNNQEQNDGEQKVKVAKIAVISKKVEKS